METSTRIRWFISNGVAAIIGALMFGAAVLVPGPAKAAGFVGFGFSFPIGFPYYYPPYPYYPPPGYYPSPPYYPPPGYSPPAAYQPSSAYAPPAPAAVPSITYTPRPGWTNAQGEYCREYKTSQGAGRRATERYGTACRDPSGQWRIVN